MDAKGKILISRPCYQYYEYDNLVTVENMINASRRAGWLSVSFWQRGSSIPRLRNAAVEQAKEGKFDKLLFVDSDMHVFADSLLKLLRHDVAVVAGVYVAKQPPHLYMAGNMVEGTVQTVQDITPGQLLPIDRAGTGFLLIDMAVFDNIEPPYFSWDAQGNDNKDGGEDFYFCRKVREAGIQIFLDTDCVVGHVGNWVYGPPDHAVYCDNKKSVKTPPLLISPGGEVLVH